LLNLAYQLTVLICVYNEGDCILKALRSLYPNKIYAETDVVLVDDCSTNPLTLRILALLGKFTRFNIVRSGQNLGLSNSRNLGFMNAKTEYVLPLDADDTLPPGTLDIVYKTFTQNNDVDFIAGNYFLNNTDIHEGRIVDCSTIATNGFIDKKKLLLNWSLLGTSPCKKSLWRKVGGYSLKYSYSIQDVDFWIRAVLHGAKGVYLNKPIYTWNRSSTGMNENFDRLDMTKLLDDHREFYLLNSTLPELNNKVFEGYYPYKQKAVLLPFARKHFFTLTPKNKLRTIYFLMTSLFKK
jgi:glycosyltransferase involved in cell wall biosynthesis